MKRMAVSTDKAPAAAGAYSQAIIAGDLVFTAGQIGMDPVTGKFVDGGFAEQACRVLENLQAIIEAAGSSMSQVVKVTCFLADINDFVALNEVYSAFFEQPFPARSAFQVAHLPLGALIEIEAVAIVG